MIYLSFIVWQCVCVNIRNSYSKHRGMILTILNHILFPCSCYGREIQFILLYSSNNVLWFNLHDKLFACNTSSFLIS